MHWAESGYAHINVNLHKATSPPMLVVKMRWVQAWTVLATSILLGVSTAQGTGSMQLYSREQVRLFPLLAHCTSGCGNRWAGSRDQQGECVSMHE